MASKIKDKDITFVVQGAVDPVNTPKCIASIRKYFKASKIILSTWENADITGLDYDVLVLNKDPGGFKFSDKFYDNTNRQIVSSLSGLKHVQTLYAIKIRSDIALLSNKFIKYFDKFNKRNNSYKLYEKRILTYIFPCKFKHLDEITPFHIGDWIYFGLSTDLIKMFDIPIIKKEDCAFNEEFPDLVPKRFYQNPQKYFPEQYICYKPLEKLYSVGFKHRFCNDEKIIEASNQFIANNYVILSHFQMPLYFLKKNRSEYCGLDYEYFQNTINFFDWLELYKKYCGSNFKYRILKRKIYLKINRIIYKNKRVKQIIEQYCKRRYE